MITADEMVAAMNEHKIGLEWTDNKRGVAGWQAKLVSNGKPFNRMPTSMPQEAVEQARNVLVDSEANRVKSGGDRLFEILSRGVIKYRTRVVSQNVDGVSTNVTVWDVQKASDNTVIVSGERSLRAAIIEAERLGAV